MTTTSQTWTSTSAIIGHLVHPRDSDQKLEYQARVIGCFRGEPNESLAPMPSALMMATLFSGRGASFRRFP